MNICAHLKILRTSINELEVVKFVEYHQNIIDMAMKLNTLFKFIIFQEYLLLSVLLCVLAFPIAYNDDIIKSIPFFMHAIAGIIDLLIYSYGGQKIMDLAGDICDDCYDANKLIVIIRSQHKLKIKSMCYHASMATFDLMIRRAMRLITLLKSFL
jgi:hypothetical protein